MAVMPPMPGPPGGGPPNNPPPGGGGGPPSRPFLGRDNIADLTQRMCRRRREKWLKILAAQLAQADFQRELGNAIADAHGVQTVEGVNAQGYTDPGGLLTEEFKHDRRNQHLQTAETRATEVRARVARVTEENAKNRCANVRSMQNRAAKKADVARRVANSFQRRHHDEVDRAMQDPILPGETPQGEGDQDPERDAQAAAQRYWAEEMALVGGAAEAIPFNNRFDEHAPPPGAPAVAPVAVAPAVAAVVAPAVAASRRRADTGRRAESGRRVESGRRTGRGRRRRRSSRSSRTRRRSRGRRVADETSSEDESESSSDDGRRSRRRRVAAGPRSETESGESTDE